MKDADDFERIVPCEAVAEKVGADGELPIAGPDARDPAPLPPAIRYRLSGGDQGSQVLVRLVATPAVCRIVPDLVSIPAGGRQETQPPH